MIIPVTLTILLALIFAFGPGCEDDPDLREAGTSYFSDNPYEDLKPDSLEELHGVGIWPSFAEFDAVGSAITFNVRGGEGPYTWALGVPGAGTLSITRGDEKESCTFVATQKQDNSLTVTDRDGRAATAVISVASAVSLTMIPTSATLAPSAFLDLEVNGGVPPYTVVQSRSGIDTLAQIDADTWRLTAAAATPGTNDVQVADDVGTIVTSRIIIQ
jgi:hypothetical protein